MPVMSYIKLKNMQDWYFLLCEWPTVCAFCQWPVSLHFGSWNRQESLGANYFLRQGLAVEPNAASITLAPPGLPPFSSLPISPRFPQSPSPTPIQLRVCVLTPSALPPWQLSTCVTQPTHTHTHTLGEVAKLQPARLISLVAPARTLNHVIRKLIQSPKQDSGRRVLFIHLTLRGVCQKLHNMC